MKIMESQIRKIMPNAKNERVIEFVLSFNKWADVFGINTPLRVCGYLSQVATETGELKATEENLNYSIEGLLKTFPKYFKSREIAERYAHKPEKIANLVYANRMGNGNEASGDGWKYKGRGYLGTTGFWNYQRYAQSTYCNGDLMSHPEWLAKQPGCQKSAMFFWLDNNLNRFADKEDIRGLSKAVNGGWNGLANRLLYWRRAKKVFCI